MGASSIGRSASSRGVRPQGSRDSTIRGRLLTFWRIGLGSLGALGITALIVAFGLGIYWGRIVDRRLAEAIAATDLEDPDWRLDDLMAKSEAIPDEENSALIVAEVATSLPEK